MYSVILNALSGKGKAIKILPALEELLRKKGVEYRVDKTSDDFGVTKLAAKAVEDGLDGVIVAGGDGTFSLAVNGIRESGLEMIFAPCGTGNDFMRMFDLPKDPLEAVEKQLDCPARMLDMGKLNDGYFLNVAGCGLDVDVLLETDRFKKRFSAASAYLRAAINTIRKYKPLSLELSVDGGETRRLDVTIIAIGNGKYFGGGMKVIPSAITDDGKLDMMYVPKVKKLFIYPLLALFVPGLHTRIKRLVTTARCTSLRIRRKGLYYEADGEISSCDMLDIRVLPGALRTRLPA